MLNQAFILWRNAIRQGAVWSTLIWSIGLILVLVLGFIAVGAGALASNIFHPQLMTLGYAPPLSGGIGLLVGILVLFVVMIALGPFLVAGTYSLFGRAVMGEPITWKSFWTLAKQDYGRGWGLYLVVLIWCLAFGLVGGILFATLHVTGIILTVIALFFTMPLALFIVGGLFVDRLSWGKSFSSMFHPAHYGTLLLGCLVLAFVYGFLYLIVLLQLRYGALRIIYYPAAFFIGVAGPIWGFALYRTARD